MCVCEKQGLYAKVCSSLPSCSKSYFIGHMYYSLWYFKFALVNYNLLQGRRYFSGRHISEHGYPTNFHEKFLEMTPQNIF